jgi:hypothetical protein
MSGDSNLNLIFSSGVNSIVENKFLLDDTITVDLRIPFIFLVITFFSYLGFCILIYLSRSLLASYYIRSYKRKKGLITSKEENSPENSFIHSIHIKYYIFFNKLPLVESYVENNILIDDKTYREFFRNMVNDPSSHDVLRSFEEVIDKTLLNKGLILADLLIIGSQIGLLVMTHFVLFYAGGLYTKYIYYVLGIILVIIFIRFLKLVTLFENIRYLNNQLLTSRDKKFLSQETNDQL